MHSIVWYKHNCAATEQLDLLVGWLAKIIRISPVVCNLFVFLYLEPRRSRAQTCGDIKARAQALEAKGELVLIPYLFT